MADSSNLWLCTECGLPNHTGLIESYNISVHNTYDILNEDCSLDEYTDLDSTVRTDTSLLEPQNASTPEAHNPQASSKKTSRPLKVVTINFRSVVRNRDRLGVFLKCVQPDIILGVETFLTKEIATPTELSEYDVERRDRDTRDGGVLIAARKDLLMVREYELETDCEVMFCRFNIAGSKTLHVGAFYRPDVTDSTSLAKLDDSINRIPKSHCLVVGGDFNLPGFEWFEYGPQLKTGASNVGEHERLVEIMFDHGLTQHICDVTRVDPYHGTENTLDLLFTNRPGSVIAARVVPGVSDHDAPVVEMDLKPIRVFKKPHDVPQYKSADWAGFSDFISEELGKSSPDWTINAPPDADVNQIWKKFQDIITRGIRKFIPHRTTRARLDLPYITPDIRRLIRRRDRLYNKVVKARHNVSMHGRASALKARYKALKRDVQQRIRRSYWRHVASLVIPAEGAVMPRKSFWSFIRRNRTDNHSISALTDLRTGKLVSDTAGKANVLNQQFESVFTRETPLTTQHRIPQEYPDIPDLNFTVKGVLLMLEGLDASKATGPDQIPPRVLKELATTLAPILTDIFNRSYRTGVCPDEWREANVVPAYKKGKKTLAENYRPISLTCICCKLFEHCVVKHIMNHNDRHDILYDFQHGFRSKLSCETQLLEFYHDLCTNCYEGHQSDVLVMDFSKAFDKVGHKRLLEKITRYGITGATRNWIEAFLSGRTQRVVLEGQHSSTAPVTSGVPQGSVLGPCLFLLYINDLAEGLESSVRLFADDTIAYMVVGNQSDAARLQRDLDRLESWEDLWQMEFHPKKCQVLRVTKKRKVNVVEASYTLRGHTLEVVDHAKYLGVTISGDLKWNRHITNIVNKANSTLAVLKRNVKVPSKEVKAAAYKALVRPHLEYASSVWDPPPTADRKSKGLAEKVEMVQRSSARWVFSKYRYGPNTTGPTEMISQLGWPLLTTRRYIARLCLMFKMDRGMVRMKYASLLVPHPYQLHDYHQNAFVTLDRSPLRLYYSNSYFPRTVAQWNSLDEAIFPPKIVGADDKKLAAQLEAFKTSLWAAQP